MATIDYNKILPAHLSDDTKERINAFLDNEMDAPERSRFLAELLSSQTKMEYFTRLAQQDAKLKEVMTLFKKGAYH